MHKYVLHEYLFYYPLTYANEYIIIRLIKTMKIFTLPFLQRLDKMPD